MKKPRRAQPLRKAVTAALEEDVKARKQRESLNWIGKVDYYDDYDPKRLRDRKRSTQPLENQARGACNDTTGGPPSKP
jgi:hypothetical protein